MAVMPSISPWVAASQAVRDLFEQRQEQAIAEEQRRIENEQRSRQIGVSEGTLGLNRDRFGFERDQWGELAPIRAANLANVQALTDRTRGVEGRESSDWNELKVVRDLLPVEQGDTPVSPRLAFDVQRLTGLSLLTPTAQQSFMTPEAIGSRAGQASLAEWKGGGQQVFASQEATKAANQGARPLSPNQELLAINRLQTQWSNAAAQPNELKRQAEMMDAGLAAARAGNLAAGSQAVLVTFQKILDPDSVVRESEYARSGQNLSLASRIVGQLERTVKGGAGVPIDELERFASVAKEFVKNADRGLVGRRARLERTARAYNLDPSLIFDDSGIQVQTQQTDAPPQQQSQTGPAVGTRGVVNGIPAVWDGRGWKRAQ